MASHLSRRLHDQRGCPNPTNADISEGGRGRRHFATDLADRHLSVNATVPGGGLATFADHGQTADRRANGLADGHRRNRNCRMSFGASSASETPAIVGAAQIIQRPTGDLHDARGPIELMVDAAVAAAVDAGSTKLLGHIDWIGVAGGFWRYQNPGQLVANALGSPSARSTLSKISGSAPLEMVGMAGDLIRRGKIDVALVAGGEAHWTVERLKRAGEEPRWLTIPGEGSPDLVPGFPDDPEIFAEFRYFGAAAAAYALMDDSLRISNGETIDAQRDRLGALWEGFSSVAAGNPYAWDRERHTSDEIRNPRSDNRMIAFPYPKAMVANNTVDMASAILLCSLDAAQDLGIAADRMVFPHVVTKAHETWRVVNRRELHGSPALAVAGLAAMQQAGIGPDDVEHVDLYACFPAIVQMSARALGFRSERQLTVTGGLGFAGAPIGNATGQSIAAMIPLVRVGGWGVVHGNGGYATKHAFGVYANHPPEHFVFEDCQERVDLQPRAALDPLWSGPAVVEAATVVYDRNGPSHVMAAARPVGPDADSRVWIKSGRAELIEQALAFGLAGVAVKRSTSGDIQDLI